MKSARFIETAAVIMAIWLFTACTVYTNYFCCTSVESCAQFPGQPITNCTDPDRPYCDEDGKYRGLRHACIPDPAICSDPSDCSEPSRPFCVNERCVECIDTSTCSATAPFCDPSEHSCRACVADTECASDVCDRDIGACVAESVVIYLSPSGLGSGTCTRTQPCNTFALGLVQVNGTRNVIKVGRGTYSGQILIDNVTVTVLADNATIQPNGMDLTALTVTNAANVTIVGLTVNGATGRLDGMGIECNGSSTLRLHRAIVTGNGGGGVRIVTCQYSLVNNIIVRNGRSTSPASAYGGVQIVSIAMPELHEFSFNTITNNTGGGGAVTGVNCSNVLVPLTFTNSIVYGNTVSGPGTQVDGAQCAWTYSNIGPEPATGLGNVNMDPLFVNSSLGDFHLLLNSPSRNKGDPAATLAVDIDFDRRPCDDRLDMGADEVCP